jgi:predicted transcriptional regulator
MDGGRILRSLLSFRMDKISATRVAQTVGKIFAVAFVIIGLFYNPFLIIIGIFVFIGAQAEYQMIKYNNVLDKYSVGDVISTDYIVLQPEDTLEKAANTLIHRSANGFIIMSDNEYRGILTKENIIKGLSSSGNKGKINEVLNGHHYSTTPEMNLNKVFQEMMRNKSPIVPVFSDNKITGILDLENIQELIMIEQASRRTEHNY